MNTLETDVEVTAYGSLKLLSPLPEWLKPGGVHVVLSVPNDTLPKAKRAIPTAMNRCCEGIHVGQDDRRCQGLRSHRWSLFRRQINSQP
jgi:hypothetical protein